MWTEVCGCDYVLGHVASGFLSEQRESIPDWKADWEVYSLRVALPLCPVVRSLGSVRSSVPSLPPAGSTNTATTFLL